MPSGIQLGASRIGLPNMSRVKLAIYAIHPIMYQVPIFSTLEKRIASQNIDMESVVLFGDDLSLRKVFFEETRVLFRPDTPNLLDGYRYILLKNFSKDSRSGFFSRINPGILQQLKMLHTNVLLVHGYESMTSWIAIVGARLMGRKVIWRGEAVLRANQSKWKRLTKKILLSALFRNCDAVMYSCSGNKLYLEHYGVSASKMFFIPCAVDNNYFRQEYIKYAPQRDEIRATLGLRSDDFVVLFCARFTERKRPMDLIEALSNIGNSKMVALFVGDGPERDRMAAAAIKKGIRVVFSGFKNQSEISRYYAIADVALVISEHDPSPKAMNEAMNFELPIIATNAVGTVPDLVQDGYNGFTIEVGDVKRLSLRLSQLLLDPALSRSMGQRSREMVAEWNYESDVDGILDAVNYAIRTA